MVNVLLLNTTSQKVANWRLDLLCKLHSALIELLTLYLSDNEFDEHTVGTLWMISNLSLHWQRWFAFIERHPYNHDIVSSSLHFMEFIHSFYSFFEGKKQKNAEKKESDKGGCQYYVMGGGYHLREVEYSDDLRAKRAGNFGF